jgi:hypothetical protein
VQCACGCWLGSKQTVTQGKEQKQTDALNPPARIHNQAYNASRASCEEKWLSGHSHGNCIERVRLLDGWGARKPRSTCAALGCGRCGNHGDGCLGHYRSCHWRLCRAKQPGGLPPGGPPEDRYLSRGLCSHNGWCLTFPASRCRALLDLVIPLLRSRGYCAGALAYIIFGPDNAYLRDQSRLRIRPRMASQPAHLLAANASEVRIVDLRDVLNAALQALHLIC